MTNVYRKCYKARNNIATTDSYTLQGGMLFEKFQSFCHPETSKEGLSKCVERVHQNENFFNIFQDYEATDKVLHQQLFNELKCSVPLIYDYIDVFFSLCKNDSLAFKHRDAIIGLLRHCMLFDGKAKKLINQKQNINAKLSEAVDVRLALENNKTNESNMDVDNANTMVSSLRTLKLSAVESFIDNCKLNGNAIFTSFENI